MEAGLLDRVLLPVAPKQSLDGEERFISNFFFWVLLGNFCALCVLRLLFIGGKAILGIFWGGYFLN